MNSYVINAQNRLIAHALKSINPELYQLCLEVPRPLLIDYRHIDFIHYEFKHQFGNVDLDNKTIYVACLYRLYNPSHLYGKFNKLPLGLRDEIARSLGYTNPENINAIAAPAPAHYKNPRTAKTINDFADSVYSILKECDELSKEEKLSGCSTAQTVLELKKYVADPAYRSNPVATK